jgi:hypothetical protein
MAQLPTIGRIVRYKTTAEQRSAMEKASPCNIVSELPAIIVAVWSPNLVNLKVFLDGLVDGKDCLWVTSAHQGEAEGQWDFPEIK